MTVQEGFAEYCRELLAPVGEVQGKRMFGGYGLYVDGWFVAIIVGDTLYLKADGETQQHFIDAGGRRFVYEIRGKQQGMGYWTVPTEAMDSPALMAPWARLALDAARRAAPARKAKPRR
ncbi:TfoX/Sxy family protein [Ramlibacter albus]|uniref:TfoX/Sxy family protein n=1 Tax=Ramlibacter albus TaxID=2079448 RepID=A0A923S2R2_9BURK|nr:TfoX/Sxy family protein [Ramlibacter albus]MBC5765739.1 TfoX/Sxy family protein [Ramlibacter albus]